MQTADTFVVSAGRFPVVDPIATRIRELLDDTGWGPAELSRRAGLSEAHISVLLNRGAAQASGAVLAKIAATCSVELEWLVSGTGPKELGRYSGEDDPRIKNLEGYLGALAVARTLRPNFQEYVWQAVGEAHPLIAGQLSPGMLVKMAEIIVEYLPPPAPPAPPKKRPRKAAE